MNFANPALHDTCIGVFYDGSTALAAVFPDEFCDTIPHHAHIFAATMVSGFLLFDVRELITHLTACNGP